jgi:hypothetical protein
MDLAAMKTTVAAACPCPASGRRARAGHRACVRRTLRRAIAEERLRKRCRQTAMTETRAICRAVGGS